MTDRLSRCAFLISFCAGTWTTGSALADEADLMLKLEAQQKVIDSQNHRIDRLEQALEEIDLSGMCERDPASLSGGQRARVALMRTLLARPEALLLDEPFSKLDQELREKFRKLVFAHALKNQLPTILVTHDPTDADAAGGKILSL